MFQTMALQCEHTRFATTPDGFDDGGVARLVERAAVVEAGPQRDQRVAPVAVLVVRDDLDALHALGQFLRFAQLVVGLALQTR